MSEEIKINKNNKSITFLNNGIAFSQFGIADEILDLIINLQNQLQQKEDIIKKAYKILDEALTEQMITGNATINLVELCAILKGSKKE